MTDPLIDKLDRYVNIVNQAIMEYPERVKRLKPSLRAAAQLDMSGYTIGTKARQVHPYEGETVWLDPYLDSSTELALTKAYEALGESPDNEAAFAFMCGLLDRTLWGWTLTDKEGQPLPQPGQPGVWEAVPSRTVLYLVNELLCIDQGEPPSGGEPSADG